MLPRLRETSNTEGPKALQSHPRVTVCLSIALAQHSHTDSQESVPVSTPDKNKNIRRTFSEFHAELVTCLRSANKKEQKMGDHSVQQDRLTQRKTMKTWNKHVVFRYQELFLRNSYGY